MPGKARVHELAKELGVESKGEEPIVNRFLFDQDTGGAIRTAGARA